jgi:hypothetical protein
LSAADVEEIVLSATTEGVFLLEIVDFDQEAPAVLTVLPPGSKFVGSAGNSILISRLRRPLSRVGERCEEIGGGASCWALPAHVLEEFAGLGGASEVDLTSFVQHNHLIEDLSEVSHSNAIAPKHGRGSHHKQPGGPDR